MIVPVSGGMWGIKLVGPVHFNFGILTNGNPTLMNFPDTNTGRQIAASIPIGHRSVIYQTTPRRRFAAAIEYIEWPTGADVLTQGREAAAVQDAAALLLAQNVPLRWTKVFRCIRVLKLATDPRDAPTREQMEELTGESFRFRQGDIMFDISEDVYNAIFNAIR